ncbi:MAG: VCBS repeat-containing protein [Planctomycetota bacterium]|nr:VCBS repeat-containing protein [Planctomycetota bacterium]MDA1251825.1 VCBS repeat-containing protein [Planctomycetota bacterium]
MSHTLNRNRLSLFAGVGCLLVVAAVLIRDQLDQPPGDDDMIGPVEQSDLVEKEGLILNLTPRLGRLLNASAMNLRVPDPMSEELFEEQVEVVGLSRAAPELVKTLPSTGVEKFRWKTGERGIRKRADIQLWQPAFDTVDFFERAKFYIVRADYTQDSPPLLETEIGFEAVAKSKTGRVLAFKAASRVRWSLPPDRKDLSADNLKIANWTTESFETCSAAAKMFEESLDTAVADLNLRKRLRTSRHEELILERHAWLVKRQAARAAKAKESPKENSGRADVKPETWPGAHEWFSNASQDRHPSVSVVDIDQDGFDDLYLMDRWRKNVLLRNRQDGTFEDVAEKYGLDFEGHCTTAMFADFDNDGDSDLFLGRSLQPSLYLENVEGKFVDRSASNVAVRMPSLVTAAAAADYNGDGLLDIYFSTYAAHLLENEIKEWRGGGDTYLLGQFLSDRDGKHLVDLIDSRENHRYFRFFGPPNLLLVNKGGGKFDVAPENEQLQTWRHTYQSTWGDYDNDGDPDLYVANDFSINNLFRNDGKAGFVDVAEETKTTDIGFGMGAAWGDYDGDGRQDLYVSNMFSKAGRRITSQLNDIDERFARMARGNSLFRNNGADFEKVSGMDAPAMQVEKAGWSWASQFCDIDNDGWLDVHALSGYYTAPPEVAVQVDL